MRHNLLILTLLLFGWHNASAVELRGRFSMLGATARAESGDWGYTADGNTTLSADQQVLRLMLEDAGDKDEWSTHLRISRLHIDGLPTGSAHSSSLFRYAELGDDLLNESSDGNATTVHYELDRLYYRRQMDTFSLSLGRQAVDWGAGKFWQPMNLFGSFSPTDLDTDYKPGIDAVTADYYPSAFSSLTAVYAFAPQDQDTIKDSAAIHYRSQWGEQSEIAMALGSITGNMVYGASFESVWQGIGWHIEGVHYDIETSDEQTLFWIAGIDYQYANGTTLSVEYYDNSRGANTQQELATAFSDPLINAGLQLQLAHRLIGVGLSRNIGPLIQGTYSLLGGVVEDSHGDLAWSLLHQLNLTYSVSNESDLLVSLLLPTGEGLTDSGEPQSEFGHIPPMLTLRLRFYF